MDVVLEQETVSEFQVAAPGLNSHLPLLVSTAELLQASDFLELVAEVRQLQQRRIRMVSIRRQNALRIGPDKLQAVLEDSGLKVCTVGFAGGFTGTLGRSYRQAVDDTRRALEFAAQLQARAVVVVPGSRGLHTYNHAERTIRDGLYDCLDDALRLRIDMQVPLNAVFGTGKDIFHPQQESYLDWIDDFGSHRIKAMMMLRGRTPWKKLPDSWQRCLRNGGVLRATQRCRITLGRHGITSHILSRLTNSAVPVC